MICPRANHLTENLFPLSGNVCSKLYKLKPMLGFDAWVTAARQRLSARQAKKSHRMNFCCRPAARLCATRREFSSRPLWPQQGFGRKKIVPISGCFG
jgi:hypothetical protein